MTLHQGSLKLASLYLAVMMAISLFFSMVVYQTSIHELDRGLRRPMTVYNTPIGPGFSTSVRQGLIDEHEAQYEEAHDRIISRLLIINLLILVGGGALSYYLALRTLKPIEEAHEAQSRFTADASHELRTPITAMRTENEVALMDPKLTLNEAKQQLQSNVEELEKLTALSEGLLRLAQIDNNHLQKTAIKARTISEAAVDRVLNQAEGRGILVSSDIQTEDSVIADQPSATEALVTLLDNAIKYAPDTSEVTLLVQRDGRTINFVVTDQGVGIKASELPHIFERFYRADSSRTKQHVDGYGLGLAIAKSIADAHHGSLTVTSQLGKGSQFTLSLPAVTT